MPSAPPRRKWRRAARSTAALAAPARPWGKVQGQQTRRQGGQLGQTGEGGGGQNLQVRTQTATAGQQDQTFQRACGMVGVEEQRTLGGDALQGVGLTADAHIQGRKAGGGKGGGVAATGQASAAFCSPTPGR